MHSINGLSSSRLSLYILWPSRLIVSNSIGEFESILATVTVYNLKKSTLGMSSRTALAAFCSNVIMNVLVRASYSKWLNAPCDNVVLASADYPVPNERILILLLFLKNFDTRYAYRAGLLQMTPPSTSLSSWP